MNQGSEFVMVTGISRGLKGDPGPVRPVALADVVDVFRIVSELTTVTASGAPR